MHLVIATRELRGQVPARGLGTSVLAYSAAVRRQLRRKEALRIHVTEV